MIPLFHKQHPLNFSKFAGPYLAKVYARWQIIGIPNDLMVPCQPIFIEKHRHPATEKVIYLDGHVRRIWQAEQDICLRIEGIASHLVMAGVPLFTVQRLLGRAQIDTTMIYAHLAEDHSAEMMAKLPY